METLERKTGLKRLFALIIDICIINILTVLLGLVIDLDRNIKEYLMIALFVIYYIYLTYFTERQTIGKRYFNLKITNEDSNNITLARIAIRCLLIIPILFVFIEREVIVIKYSHGQKGLDGMIPMIYLVYFAFTDSFLHDKISKTKIIKC